MARLLLDSEIFIRHIRGREHIRPAGHFIHYSSVTRAELFAGGSESTVRELLNVFIELPVDRAVAERAGRVRRTSGIDLPDALIAATAQEHGLTLVSTNVRHFKRVKGLRVRSRL